MTQPVSYKITVEIPFSYMGKLFDYIYNQYLTPQKKRFTDIDKETSSQGERLAYTIVDPQGKRLVRVEVKSGQPLEINLTPLDPTVSPQTIEEAKQDIIISTQIFRENAKKATVYFAWRQGEEVVPEAYTKPEKSFNRLFLETQVLFFVVFIVLGTGLFIGLLAFYPSAFLIAPLVLIAVQFVFVFYSNNFIARTADWKITEDNPIIHFLEYYLPADQEDDFKKKYSREQLLDIKKEIYDEILAKKGEVDPVEAQQVFLRHGVPCQLENLKAKKVNVYELVRGMAERFKFPMPKIVVSNTMVPNAAASGPSPSRGLVLITTGLMVQLDEQEIQSVLGHEFGHLKGRDPLILYGLVSTEFLFRFYVLLYFFPFIFTSLLFFVYFWAVMVVIFFIAKFFEARADLVSAIMVGTPQILAGSLEKIGFQRLLYERTPSFRLQEWLGLDPHPPIYFRVDRLENLPADKKIKHPLLQSIRDVTKGFAATLRS